MAEERRSELRYDKSIYTATSRRPILALGGCMGVACGLLTRGSKPALEYKDADESEILHIAFHFFHGAAVALVRPVI